MADEKIPRRDFLKAAGAASATGAALATGLAACSAEMTTTAQTAAAAEPEVWLTLECDRGRVHQGRGGHARPGR